MLPVYYIKRFGFLLFIIIFFLLPGCSTPPEKQEIIYSKQDLPKYGAKLVIPGNWSIRRGDNFQFTATGSTENNRSVSMQYRGLQRIKKDEKSQAQYADGWYLAVQRNYQGWKFISKHKITTEIPGSFAFEGTYQEGGVTYRVIGKLRFRGNRLHSLFYTAPDEDFELIRPLINALDVQHGYYPVKEEELESNPTETSTTTETINESE